MKKIIYSLVIMIAAGSLFTSCIDQVEPVGILDMRTAKAEYIRALKDLRAADAEYRRAEAAVQLANAAYRQAETAWMQEQVNNQKLLNELQALKNEAEAMDNELKAAEVAKKIADLENAMEEAAAQHAINMVNLENNLAKAEEDLRVSLRNIALSAQELTAEERQVIQEAANYYWKAYEEVAEQTIAVMKAQRLVDSLKEAKVRFADKDWDKTNHAYAYKVDLWQREIDKATADKAKQQALKDKAPKKVGDKYPDVKEWKATLDELKKAKEELAYSKHELVEEISTYYVNYVHDGYKTFNLAAEAWEAENPVQPNPGNEAPKYTEGQTSYTTTMPVKIDDVDYPAGTTVGEGDTIAMPVLEAKATATFAKFESMLAPYFSAFPNKAAGATGNYQVKDEDGNLHDVYMIRKDGDNWKLYVNQYYKEFLLGDEEGTVGSQVYNEYDENGNTVVKIVSDYGLNGAVSVLERKMVTEEEEAENYKDSVEKYQKIWKADRDTLAAVFGYYPTWDKLTTAQKEAIDKYHTATGYLTKYEPYATAIAAYATAKEAYDAEVQAVKDQKTNLIGAVKMLKAEFDKVNGKAGITYNDSLAIFNALKDFAAKRQAYLGYTYKAGQQHDSTKFYYGAAVDSKGKVVKGVVAFSELDFNELRDGTYDKDTTVSGGILEAFAAKNSGLAGMAKQILSDEFGAAIGQEPMNFGTDYSNVHGADAFKENGNRALYNNYYVDNFLNPTKVVVAATGDEYEKTVSTADLDKADAAVIAAIAAYKDVYERYWGLNTGSYPGITAEKDPECYVVESFIDPFCIANFDGNKLLWTPGLGAVLGSVDPLKADAKGVNFKNTDTPAHVEGSYIFGTEKASDFFTYMYYQDKIDVIDAQDLETIKEWVVLVEMAFALSEGIDEAVVYEFYQADSTAYAKAKTAYDKYQTALKEFTGVNEDGNANGIFVIDDYSNLVKFFDQDNETLKFNAADWSTLFNEFTGEWAEGLGGAQLELAKVLFPDAPLELLEWQYAYAEINDDIAHAEILYDSFEKAYLAAAKAAEYAKLDGDDTVDTLYVKLQNSLDAYIATLNNNIANDETKINTNKKNIADFWSEVPVIDIAIAEAEVDLAEAETKYNAAVTALDYAKANLQRVMDYMKSLDANFLNGSELEFPWNATTTGGSTTGGSTTGGSTWPSFPWTI